MSTGDCLPAPRCEQHTGAIWAAGTLRISVQDRRWYGGKRC